jgi:hypothetical protein
MSDIADRLERPCSILLPGCNDVRREGAAEIRRLRGNCASLAYAVENDGHTITDLRADNRFLRETLIEAQGALIWCVEHGKVTRQSGWLRALSHAWIAIPEHKKREAMP